MHVRHHLIKTKGTQIQHSQTLKNPSLSQASDLSAKTPSVWRIGVSCRKCLVWIIWTMIYPFILAKIGPIIACISSDYWKILQHKLNKQPGRHHCPCHCDERASDNVWPVHFCILLVSSFGPIPSPWVVLCAGFPPMVKNMYCSFLCCFEV